MNEFTRKTSMIRSLVPIAIGAMVVGAVILLVAVVNDAEGLAGGAVIGAAIGLLVVGAYFWGYANGLRRPEPRGQWLPSEDERR